MLTIRKDDIVEVISGRDKGKKGKVLRVFPQGFRALVEGINLVKKHRRKTQQQQQEAGIINIESPISISNVQIFCKSCNKPSRVGIKIEGDSKNRICKKCNGVI